ncbi:MAG TPA: site-2 protease family protein [Mycobacteriales bacterium]|nr:site-2 protease family protein [Mycobacteriales bacterium]
MIYLAGALGFLVALLLSVMLHEGGHFLTARHYGMKATHFFVGFGPTLFSRQVGETEYGVKAIPAGGYVKIVGMTPLEELEEADQERAFYRQPARRKVVVLAAGSTMHFLIAVLLVVGGTFAIGTVQEQPPSVGALACVVPTVADRCSPTSPPSPAQLAGLQAGDRVLAIDGRPVPSVEAFQKAVRAAAGRPLAMTVDRDGARQDLQVVPVQATRPSLTDARVTEQVGAVGVQLALNYATERVGPWESVQASGTVMKTFAIGIKTTVTEKLGTVTKLYGDERDPAGLVGIVGAGRISGEVLASTETAGVKALSFVLLVASLNLFVGLFNLLPLLPLDGGHIAVVVFESLRDKARRLRGYRGPLQRVDYNKLAPLTYGVAGAFLLLTLFILGADIVNPIRIG